uniref:Large ribosomal subunit protein mL44 n=2 Tax=Caenorhabditis japonica TaxID=281687 RepID=A0A8R1I708_CAEJA
MPQNLNFARKNPALTNESFFERADVEEHVESAQPGADVGTEHNSELVKQGAQKLSAWLKRYLRFHLTSAPEELIEAVEEHLLADECLAEIAKHIGVDNLVRTKEFPVSQHSCANCFRALAGVFSEEKVKNVVIDFVVPQLVDIDFSEIYPLANPMDVLTDLLKAEGITEIEPRLLRSAGVNSAEPIYVAAIYTDKQKNVGKSAGESLTIAVDMASREALLRLWNITSDR